MEVDWLHEEVAAMLAASIFGIRVACRLAADARAIDPITAARAKGACDVAQKSLEDGDLQRVLQVMRELHQLIDGKRAEAGDEPPPESLPFSGA